MIRSIENVDTALRTVVDVGEESESSSSEGQEFSEVLASLLGKSRTRTVSADSAQDAVLHDEFAEVRTTQELKEIERLSTSPKVEPDNSRGDTPEKTEVEELPSVKIDESKVAEVEAKAAIEEEKISIDGVEARDILVEKEKVEVKEEVVQAEESVLQSEGMLEVEKIGDTLMVEVTHPDHEEHLASADDAVQELNSAVQAKASTETQEVQKHDVDASVVTANTSSEGSVVQDSTSEDSAVSEVDAQEASVNKEHVDHISPHSEVHESQTAGTEVSNTAAGDVKQLIRDAIQSAEKVASTLGGRTGFLPGSIKPVVENALAGLSALKERARSDRHAKHSATPLLPHEMKTLKKVEQALKDAVWKNGKLVELRLDPPELGTIKLRVQMRDGGLHTTLRAESQDVTNLLRDRAYELQGLLRGLGLDFEKITVSVYSDEQSASLYHNPGEGGSSSSRQDSDSPETSEDFSSLMTNGHNEQGNGNHVNRAIQEDHWVA